MKDKGFTLIELLAVIVILGILLIIAIPSVTRYINDSRKEVYIKTAKQVISGARNMVNEGKFEMYNTSVTYYISNSCVRVENGQVAKSPYGEFVKAYVVVTYDGRGYSYFWTSVDDTGTGIKKITSISDLDIDDISTDLKESDVTSTRALSGKTSILLLQGDCKSFIDQPVEETEEMNFTEALSNIVSSEEFPNEEKDPYHIIDLGGGDGTCTNTLAYDTAGNLRYVGNNPCNYVSYNGELWRIIEVTGETNKRVKIQREDSIGSYAWDSNGLVKNLTSHHGSNNWNIADLMKTLNPGYDENKDAGILANNSLYWNAQAGKCANDYYRANGSHLKNCDFTENGQKGLSDNAKNYISSTTWYLGSVNYNTSKANGTPAKWYGYEIGGSSPFISNKTVGMIYQSDYGFAVGGTESIRRNCLNTTLINWSSSCAGNSWLYHGKGELILSRNSANSDYIYYISGSGAIADMQAGQGWFGYDIRPVVYLNSNVKISGNGTGTKSSPYQISK